MKLYYVKIDKDWDELDAGDSVIFELPTERIKYKIMKFNSWFLGCTTTWNNDRIFSKLGIRDIKHSWVESIVGYTCDYDFPEVKTLEDLKKVIKALDDECVKKFGMPKEPSDSKESKEIHPSELKEGDYIRISNAPDNTYIYIVKGYTGVELARYVSYNIDVKNVDLDIQSWRNFKNTKITYATPEEKKLLDDALLERGYIWDNINKRILEVGNLKVTSKTDVVTIPKEHYINDCISRVNPVHIPSHPKYGVFVDTDKKELNLFPTKKHYQLNFSY